MKRHGEDDILLDRQCIQEIIVLKHKTQILLPKLGKGILFHLGDIRISIPDMSRRHTVNRREHIQKRRLPGAGGSHDSYKFSLRYGKADPVDRFRHIRCIAVILLHITYTDIISHVPSLPSVKSCGNDITGLPLVCQLYFTRFSVYVVSSVLKVFLQF